jgi:2-dehydropantoate 2-reductase
MAADVLRIAVLGPGGIGGLLAAVLARGGSSVELLAREETVRAITERGLRLQSSRFGDFSVRVSAAERLTTPVDACLLTVKSTQLVDALERVPAAAAEGSLVVPFLNGIDHVDMLRTVYPPASVTPATIRVEAARIEPGVIRQAGPFATIDIAASDASRERVERLADELTGGGFDVRVRGDETQMLWEKLALLAPLALLTTRERATLGAVRTRRRDDLVAAIAEAAAVAAAEGALVDADLTLRLLDSAPEAMESSMQRDQAAGLPLEIDSIGGAVIRRAAIHGIAVPVTTRLVAELESRSSG